MADYVGLCRSNYVRPKDKAALIEFLRAFDDICITERDDQVCFYAEEGGLPSRWTNDDERETLEDRAKDLADLLADGEVLVIQEIGFERLRYFVGFSIAIHSSGRTTRVSIEDIYELASLEFDVESDAINHCSY